MQLVIGNPAPIERIKDPRDGRVKVVAMSGVRETTFRFPEGLPLDEAFKNVLDAIPYHFRSGSKPAWIEGDDATLVKMLCQHYSILLKDNKRPRDWGHLAPLTPEDQQ
jgi:hypothetical protein